MSLTERSLAPMRSMVEGCDQYLAVQEVLKMGSWLDSESLRAEVDRFYAIAKASLESIWPAVVAVAQALMKRSELDSRDFRSVVAGHDIYRHVFVIQKAYGLRG